MRKIAYIFDVDGVLANLQTKKTSSELILCLVTLIKQGAILCINTGRSIQWLKEKLLPELTEDLSIQERNYLFIAGEQGGTWGWFEDGRLQTGKDGTLEVSSEIRRSIEDIAKKTTTLFFDNTKETMVSLEMKDGTDIEAFTRERDARVPQIQILVDKLQPQLVVTPAQISIDLQNQFAGKDQGIRRLLMLLEKKAIIPEKTIAFGDSLSDLEMAEELYRSHIPVEFVYVGEKELEKAEDFKIVKAQQKFEFGTLEYLQTRSEVI